MMPEAPPTPRHAAIARRMEEAWGEIDADVLRMLAEHAEDDIVAHVIALGPMRATLMVDLVQIVPPALAVDLARAWVIVGDDRVADAQTLVAAFGAAPVAQVLRRTGGRGSVSGWRYALTHPELWEEPWFWRAVPHMGPAWDSIQVAVRPNRAVFDPDQWIRLDPHRAGVIAEQLVRGVSPREIAGGVLTAKEAHRWLREATDVSPSAWLARTLGVPPEEARRLAGASRTVLVWYARKRTTREMSAQRTWVYPDGTTGPVTMEDIVDEVLEEDLIHGEKTDVEVVFARMITRRAKDLAGTFPLYPQHGAVPGIRQVVTASELVEIGRRERHCAGQYVRQCTDGELFLFIVELEGARSLFSTTTHGRVLEHYARANTTPLRSHREAVAAWERLNCRAHDDDDDDE